MSIWNWFTRDRIILGSIILTGLLLRVWQINFGLPELYLEDEPFFTNPAISVAGGKIDPDWYGVPGSTLMYGLGILFWFVHVALNLVHGSQDAILIQYQTNPTWFHIAGRLVMAICGTLIALVLYGLVKPWKQSAALWVAGLSAGSFFLIEHSHIIRPDIVQTLLLLCVWYFYQLGYRQPQKLRWYILAGACLGLATTTKYPALFITPVLLVAIWRHWTIMWSVKKVLITVTATIVAAFCSAPFAFLHLSHTWIDIKGENRLEHGTHSGFNFFGNLWWYVSQVLDWQVGTVIFIVAMITVVVLVVKPALRKRSGLLLWIIASGLVYLLCLSTLNLHWERWAIPVMTILLIPAAIGIDAAIQWLRQKPLPAITITLGIVVLLAAPAMRLLRLENAYTQPYSTGAARIWAEQHIPVSSKVAGEPYTLTTSTHQYTVELMPSVGIHSLKYYREQGFQYVALSEAIYSANKTIVTRGEQRAGALAVVPRYDNLVEKSELIYHESGGKYLSPTSGLYVSDWAVWRTLGYTTMLGPSVYIYRLPK